MLENSGTREEVRLVDLCRDRCEGGELVRVKALERVPSSGSEGDQVRASVRRIVPYLDVAQGVSVVDDALDCLAGDVEPRCDLAGRPGSPW